MFRTVESQDIFNSEEYSENPFEDMHSTTEIVGHVHRLQDGDSDAQKNEPNKYDVEQASKVGVCSEDNLICFCFDKWII